MRIVIPAKRRLTLREIHGEASVMRVLSVLPDDTPTLRIAIVAAPLAAAVEVGATLLEHGHDRRSGGWEAAGVEPSPGAVDRRSRRGSAVSVGEWPMGGACATSASSLPGAIDTPESSRIPEPSSLSVVRSSSAPRQFDAVVCDDVLYCVPGRNRCWAGHGRWSTAAAIS
jgi:hypothetical protein